MQIALVLFVFITFGRLLTFAEVDWDDYETIFRNPLFMPVTGDTYAVVWTRPLMEIYIPVTQTIWATLAALSGGPTADGGYRIDAFPFRVLSLLVHAASTLLVYRVLRRLRFSTPVAAFSGVLFAVHPIQVEAVSWISGQKDLLAACLVIAAVWAALHLVETTHRWRWIGIVWTLGLIAMLAKPQAVTVSATVLLIGLAAGVRWRDALVSSLPLLVPALALAIVGRAAQPVPNNDPVPLWGRPLVAIDAIGWYASTILWPVDLVIDHARRPAVVLSGIGLTPGLIGLAAIAVVVALCWPRERRAITGLLVAIAGVFPVLGFVPFLYQYHSTVTEHYAYHAMLGVSIVAASLASRVRPDALRVAGVGLIVIWCVMSFRQTAVFRTTETLFGHNLKVVPESMAAKRQAAFWASRRGDDAEAIRLLNGALETHPKDPAALYNLGNIYFRQCDLARARDCYESAIRWGPQHFLAHHNLGVLFVESNDLDAAEREFARAVEIEPKATNSARALARIRAMKDGRLAVPTTTPAS